MSAGWLIVAHKEILDHLRDRRSLGSSALYALMGPFVGLMVSFSKTSRVQSDSSSLMLVSTLSVFALVSAFVGGMNVAMDCMAGERERRSLLPLLLNPISQFDIVTGKWIATSVFSAGALALNAIGCAFVFRLRAPHLLSNEASSLLFWVVGGLLPLTVFAAALEILLSAGCRSSKEAHTALSVLVLVPMFVGMFLVFYPDWLGRGWFLLPIVGQQSQINHVLREDPVSLAHGVTLATVTIAAAFPAIFGATHVLTRNVSI